MQRTFLHALIYKKPPMKETAALFTNRKQLKHPLCTISSLPPSIAF